MKQELRFSHLSHGTAKRHLSSISVRVCCMRMVAINEYWQKSGITVKVLNTTFYCMVSLSRAPLRAQRKGSAAQMALHL